MFALCLPEEKPIDKSYCLTTGINKNSEAIELVPVNLFNNSFCIEKSVDEIADKIENHLCAGIPSKNGTIIGFNGEHEQDFGGPLICYNELNEPFLAGVSLNNTFSSENGHPGEFTQ